MSYIITIKTILKKFIPKEVPKPVGRWRMEDCNIKMNKKIDLSNEDHCGPCGQYILEKCQQEIITSKNKDINIKYPKSV